MASVEHLARELVGRGHPEREAWGRAALAARRFALQGDAQWFDAFLAWRNGIETYAFNPAEPRDDHGRWKHAPVPPDGFKVIYGGYSREAPDYEAAAREMLKARAEGHTNVRVNAATSLTQQRPINGHEAERLLDVATRLAVAIPMDRVGLRLRLNKLADGEVIELPNGAAVKAGIRPKGTAHRGQERRYAVRVNGKWRTVNDYDLAAKTALATFDSNFDPHELRDDHGRWTSGTTTVVDAPLPPSLEQLEAELTKTHGLKLIDPNPKFRHSDARWEEILRAVHQESKRLNARYPGVTKGVVLSRETLKNPMVLGQVVTSGDLRMKLRPVHGVFKPNYPGIPASATVDTAGVFRHELGHVIDYRTKKRYRDAVKQTRLTYKGQPIDAATWGKYNLSKYAGTMTSETIAEMWAWWTDEHYGQPGERKLTPRFEQIMEAMGTDGPPPPPEQALPVAP